MTRNHSAVVPNHFEMHTEKFRFDLPRDLLFYFLNILACIMFAHIFQQRVTLFNLDIQLKQVGNVTSLLLMALKM